MAKSLKKTTNTGVRTIQSIDRALDILECLCQKNSYRLGELAEACHLNKATAYHILKTFEERGYVEQSYDTQVYKIGWKGFELFASLYQNIDIKPVITPYMEQVLRKTDETVTLYYFVKFGDYYQCINFMQMESSKALKFSSKIGERSPVHCTAAGKVRFLGYSDMMLQEQLKNTPFNRYTEHTVVDKEQFLRELDTIRQQGYCIEREEYLPGICSVAVPIFKYTGRVIYALDVSVPSLRAVPGRMEEIAGIMMETLSTATVCPDFLFKGAPIPKNG